MIKLLVFFIFILFISCNSKDTTKSEMRELPSINLLLSDSINVFNTIDIPKGKPIILFYFGAYCDHSRILMKRFLKDMDFYKNVNFYLITDDSFYDMRAFYRNFSLDQYYNIKVGIDNTSAFRKHFKANGYPYLVLYDKNGRLIETFYGEVYSRQIKKSLNIN
ncbi:thioredoxin-like domain-containing protein [Chitinophaga sancti]|uniref:TlpA family protein disulfide reductase n=1 Tax=Chitinophaga sancti TaxID=1004 RepID=UPI002A75322B|nr:thioredoxin-like domain-containing protein [Chitinophaga sancti]WPQ63354.1 thioredoxin-like domain-containing protein [Chitinophaga sancti]